MIAFDIGKLAHDIVLNVASHCLLCHFLQIACVCHPYSKLQLLFSDLQNYPGRERNRIFPFHEENAPLNITLGLKYCL